MKAKSAITEIKYWLAFIAIYLIIIYRYYEFIRPQLLSFDLSGPSVEGSLPTADTYTYWFHASETALGELPYNLIGPVSLIKLFGANIDLIFAVILILISITLAVLSKYAQIKGGVFAVLLMCNPIIFSQVYAINKEILMIISVLLLITYIVAGFRRHIIFALLFALLAKFQLFFLMCLFLFIRRAPVKKRKLFLIYLVLIITVVYNEIPNMDSYNRAIQIATIDAESSSVRFLALIASEHYGYIVTIIPRLFLNLYSSDILFSLPYFVMCVIAYTKSRFRLDEDIFLFFILFLIMVSVLPIAHGRYLLPTYPVVLYLCLRKKKSEYVERAAVPRHI